MFWYLYNTLTSLLLELKSFLFFYIIPVEFQCFKHTLATLLPELKLLFCIIPVVFWCLYNTLTTLLLELKLKLFYVIPVVFWCLYKHTDHFTAGTQTVLLYPRGVLVFSEHTDHFTAGTQTVLRYPCAVSESHSLTMN